MSCEPSSDSVTCDLGKLQFETGGLDNLTEVMKIMERAFSSTYGEAWNSNQCRSMLSLPGTQLTLARSNTQLCGFAICRNVLGELEILMIAVAPELQNMGIAGCLLSDISTKALNENVEVIFLEVRSNNPAQSLYQKHGFEKIGIRTAYYTGANKIRYDAHTYRKLLKSNS